MTDRAEEMAYLRAIYEPLSKNEPLPEGAWDDPAVTILWLLDLADEMRREIARLERVSNPTPEEQSAMEQSRRRLAAYNYLSAGDARQALTETPPQEEKP